MVMKVHQRCMTSMSASIDLASSSAAPFGEPKTWTLVLDEYQRNNLLWLLNLVGYPYGNVHATEPFHLANTGDWVGEIVLKLADSSGSLLNPKSNVAVENVRKNVNTWIVHQPRIGT